MSINERTARLLTSVSVFDALRYPQYRRFWFGNLASVSGQQAMWVVQGWLIYELSESPLYLGYVGLAGAAPAIALNLFGGVLADRLDQRRLIVWLQFASGALVLALATLTILDLVQIWHILAIAFLIGALQAFSSPARQSIFPHLLDRRDLMKAISLNSMVWQGTRIVAPAGGGLLIALIGSGATLFACGLSFVAFGLMVRTLRVPSIPRAQGGTFMGDMAQGLTFVRDNSLFSFLIGMTFFNSFFGLAALQLMPVFAVDILDVGASGLGLLYSVSGVGALLGIFVVGSLGSIQRKGLLLIGGATLYGGFLVLFAVSTWFPLSLSALFLLGLFSSIYMISVQTTLQVMVPDVLRGRVMGIYGMSWNMGPLGAIQAGAIASLLGAPASASISGILVAAFALIVASSNAKVRRLEPQPA